MAIYSNILREKRKAKEKHAKARQKESRGTVGHAVITATKPQTVQTATARAKTIKEKVRERSPKVEITVVMPCQHAQIVLK